MFFFASLSQSLPAARRSGSSPTSTRNRPCARIEVNENVVGTAPCDVTLFQRGENHLLRQRVIVKAYPADGSQGQYPQEKFLVSHQRAPEHLLFIMTNPPPAPKQ